MGRPTGCCQGGAGWCPPSSAGRRGAGHRGGFEAFRAWSDWDGRHPDTTTAGRPSRTEGRSGGRTELSFRLRADGWAQPGHEAHRGASRHRTSDISTVGGACRRWSRRSHQQTPRLQNRRRPHLGREHPGRLPPTFIDPTDRRTLRGRRPGSGCANGRRPNCRRACAFRPARRSPDSRGAGGSRRGTCGRPRARGQFAGNTYPGGGAQSKCSGRWTGVS